MLYCCVDIYRLTAMEYCFRLLFQLLNLANDLFVRDLHGRIVDLRSTEEIPSSLT